MAMRIDRLREYINIYEKLGIDAALARWEKQTTPGGPWESITGIGDLENPDLSIRVTPSTYQIGNQTVQPASTEPKKGETIYLPHIATKTGDFVISDIWTGAPYQQVQLENGIVFMSRGEPGNFVRGLRNLIRTQLGK